MFTFYSVSFILNSKVVLFLSHIYSLLLLCVLTAAGGYGDHRSQVLPALAPGLCVVASLHSIPQYGPTLPQPFPQAGAFSGEAS